MFTKKSTLENVVLFGMIEDIKIDQVKNNVAPFFKTCYYDYILKVNIYI